MRTRKLSSSNVEYNKCYMIPAQPYLHDKHHPPVANRIKIATQNITADATAKSQIKYAKRHLLLKTLRVLFLGEVKSRKVISR